jgi:membrane protease YdiL (CAAX protease family)
VLFQAIGLTGLLGFLPFLRPVRRFVARVLPIDPDSAVHMTALVYAVYLVGQGLGQQPLLTNAEVLGSLGLEVTSGAVWAQALGLALLAMTGIGLFVRRDWRQALDRLGLAPVTLRGLGVAAGGVVALMALQIVVALAWQQVDPAGFQALEDANNLLLGQFTGLGAALTIGLSAALGEELLFRGALQPRFGLLATAILFTMVHSQYGLSPATLLILAIALVLGWLRVRTSLTVCILVHFGYNFTSVLLPSLASGG